MSYSLYELNEYVRQVLALNFSEALWVRCELGQVKHSRGHCYLDVLQKSENGEEIVALSQAVIWALKMRDLRNKLGLELDVLLQEGIEVLLLVKIDFHERFGLKLMVQDIDPAYTLGQLALKRRETVLQLKKEGLLELNKQINLPAVIQRIAILSSESAAGLKDFLNEMSTNQFGYSFQFNLFPVAMQGTNVTADFSKALKKIKIEDFDALVIIRGGGSKLDLVAFDDYELCKKIAKVKLPVICGIGHEIDETVLDRVAHSSLKTPTAVAGYIIQHNMTFETNILELSLQLKRKSISLIHEQNQLLSNSSIIISQTINQKINHEKMMIGFIQKEWPNLIKNKITTAKSNLTLLEKSVYYLGPEMN
ncbi:MAG: exodeoxyribonuclease VII large subunit, partial [Bacteroidota bacterium]